MEHAARTLLPKWLQEFKRFQVLMPQIYLYGNVYDCYYYPVNYRKAKKEEELQWAKFNQLRQLLTLYLRSEGYEIVTYYDVLDGIAVEAEDKSIDKNTLIKFLDDDQPGVAGALRSGSLDTIAGNLGDTLSFLRMLVSNNKRLSAGIVNFTSRFHTDPNSLNEIERQHFLKMVKSAEDARTFPDKNGNRSLLVFICDKLSDIPGWVLLENPLTKGIEVKRPDKKERKRFFQIQANRFYHEGDPINHRQVADTFTDLTDGLTGRELENLVTLSHHETLHINDIKKIVDLFKYGTKDNFWEELEKSKIENSDTELRKRVLGQEPAIKKAVEIVRRARLGLHAIDQHKPKNRPKGVLFFAGPTGVGKTELAKSLAELIFADEDAILRFDMSEYNDSNSDVKLIGSPPGYVGYEEGGQLTRRVKERPFSIILFDEIEKAHPIVFDKFLQILDDGRLTDGKGETVYFGETLIIFTSNLGVYTLDERGRRVPNITLDHSYEEMAGRIMNEIRQFFNATLNRPEILNRFGDNFVVFDFIRPDVDKLILVKVLKTIQANLKKQKNCVLEFDEDFVESFRKVFVKDNLMHGGRGINNRVETHIKNEMVNFMFEENKTENIRFRMVVDEAKGKVSFECIGK